MDIAFPRLRIAVYIDGCFWHACPLHPFAPKRNSDYWSAKFAANRIRDVATTELLQQQGWLVLRFWEHESVEDVVASVQVAVRRRRSIVPPRPQRHAASSRVPAVDDSPTLQ